MSDKSFGSSGFGIATVEEDERRASKYLVWFTGVTLVLALTWAAFFQLDEITRGQGKVIPTSREQVIQSLDTGVLSEMYVREGSIVEKDQVLLQIDDSRSGAVYREAQEKYMALSAQAARLKAEAYGTPLAFPADIRPDGHPKLPHLWPVKLPQARRPNYDVSGPMAMRAAASLSR